VNPAVRRARADRDHAQRLRRQTIDPFVGRDRLAGPGIRPKRGPVAFFLDLLVGDRAFDDEDERLEFPLFREIPELQKVVSVFIREHRVVQVHCR
jgi:hypothetical protein